MMDEEMKGGKKDGEKGGKKDFEKDGEKDGEKGGKKDLVKKPEGGDKPEKPEMSDEDKDAFMAAMEACEDNKECMEQVMFDACVAMDGETEQSCGKHKEEMENHFKECVEEEGSEQACEKKFKGMMEKEMKGGKKDGEKDGKKGKKDLVKKPEGGDKP